MTEPEREVAPNIASLAALIGEPARAAMLWSLMGKQSRPAGELARIAGTSPQAASAHLSRLVDGGLLAVEPRGRHRFYRLSGPQAASAIESLAAMATVAERGARVVSLVPKSLRLARRCWGHLAGEIGVEVHDALIAGGWIVMKAEGYELTASGRAGLARLGVDVASLRATRRGLVHPCPDWSERRPHLGGPVAQGLLTKFLEQLWFTETRESRQLRVTQVGHERFRLLLEAISQASGLDVAGQMDRSI